MLGRGGGGGAISGWARIHFHVKNSPRATRTTGGDRGYLPTSPLNEATSPVKVADVGSELSTRSTLATQQQIFGCLARVLHLLLLLRPASDEVLRTLAGRWVAGRHRVGWTGDGRVGNRR